MARVKFGGFVAPHHPIGEHPTLQLQRDLELAEHLDKLGYDEFWCGEHHSTGWEVIASPELFLAAAGERTHRIKLGTGVVSLPYHHPFNVAQRLVQLDHMTRGRVIFGSGPGALPSDAYTLGIDPMVQRDRQDENADRYQSDRRVFAEPGDEQAGDCISEQDVARPKHVAMQGTENEQQQLPASVQRLEVHAARHGTLRHDDDPGAEQHRENRHELQVEEQVGEEPDAEVVPLGAAHQERIDVGRIRHGKRVDVHDENAEHGNAAQRVDGGQPFGGGDRGDAAVSHSRATCPELLV